MSRANANRWGHRAERLAGLYLRFKGYQVLERRFTASVGEIDLIALKGQTLIFVEVKWRQTIEIARASITGHQRQRIVRAAESYLRLHPEFSHHDMRFDVLAMGPWTWPQHIIDAWRT